MPGPYVYCEERYLLVGTVTKPHGLRGEVRVRALSGEPHNLGRYHRLFLVDTKGDLSPELSVTSFRVQKDWAVISLDRVQDRDFAEKLCGMGVLVDRRDLPQPESGEFYWHTLLGLQVRTVDGRELGPLRTVFSNSAQDVMVIGEGAREYLVPVSEGMVVTHDDSGIVIDPPPGLLTINAQNDDAS